MLLRLLLCVCSRVSEAALAMLPNFLKRKSVSAENLPRYWPILFVVGNAGDFLTHFHLQKTIYLLKVEGRVPIRYKFGKDAYGPYDLEIKSDAIDLEQMGLLSMMWERAGWKFRVLPRGREQILQMEQILGDRESQRLKQIVRKYCFRSVANLAQYIYAQHIKTTGEHRVTRDELSARAQQLLRKVETYPPSRNRHLLAGGVDYCHLALQREQLHDPVHRDQLYRAITAILEEASAIVEVAGKDTQALEHISLDGFEETFNYCKKAVEDLGVLPDLSSDDADWSVLVEQEQTPVAHAKG